jgi:hypothetical protein
VAALSARRECASSAERAVEALPGGVCDRTFVRVVVVMEPEERHASIFEAAGFEGIGARP